MIKSSRPLLGGHGKTSVQLQREAWEETPLTMLTWSKKDAYKWELRRRHELGIRDTYSRSKLCYSGYAIATGIIIFGLTTYAYIPFLMIFTQKIPEYYNSENGVANAKRWGIDVWCADGKFLKAYFHINPPMLTITADEI
jgi:hypothetical protein